MIDGDTTEYSFQNPERGQLGGCGYRLSLSGFEFDPQPVDDLHRGPDETRVDLRPGTFPEKGPMCQVD